MARVCLFHKLRTGDVLFFLYEGQCIFTVHLCDKNGKVRSSKRGRDEEDEEQAPNCKVVISDCLDLSSDSEIERENKQTIGESSSRHDVARTSAKKIFVSGRMPVTDRQKQNALSRARKFQSPNPCFTKTMLTTSIYRSFYLVVPIAFSRENRPTAKSTVSLVLPRSNKKWNVTCTYITYTTGHKRQPLWRFLGGWSNFILDNNLEEGDVCVFEMKKELQMTVHIFRVVEKIVKLNVVG